MTDEMDEIWALYADDGAQAIDAVESALLALQEAGGQDPQSHVGALFRGVHTFKGNSRVLGLGVVESRAHLAEDLIGLVRDDGVPLDAEIIDLLIETCDRLREMLDITAATHGDVDPAATEDLVARLSDKITRCRAASAGDSADVPAAPSAAGTAPDIDASAPDASAPLPNSTPGPAPEPEATAEAVPEAATEIASEATADVVPEPASTAMPAKAEPPASAAAPRLADDAGYRAIFAEMVTTTLVRLGEGLGAGDVSGASRLVGDLSHAATHLGLTEWTACLSGFPAQPDAGAVAALIAALEQLAAGEKNASCADDAAPEPPGFFERLREPLSVIARHGIDLATLDNPPGHLLAAAVAEVVAASEERGFPRVTEVAGQLLHSTSAADYRRVELRLFEELALVESVHGGASLDRALSPAALLASWAADHVFDTLDGLDATLERIRQSGGTNEDHQSLARLVRLVHHACRNYKLDTASQLAMSLLDLFERMRAAGQAPDAILMRIARGFIDTLALVFDALRAGEAPDTDRLEQLFAEASEAGFAGAGVMTATSIERKLNLPPEFHRVLSPDSIRAAADAIRDGLDFHILRADVNSDNDMAEALFELIGSGVIQAITNVTVFRGDETLFDFLIATRLDQLALAEAFARLDPGGRRLVLVRQLQVERGTNEEAASDEAEDSVERWSQLNAGVDLSAETLEQIGEIAAGQAMIHGIIVDLAETPLPDVIAQIMRQHQDDPRQAQAALRAMAEGVMTRLRDLAQAETQILGQMTELQQTTAELRSRPVETLLRPFMAMVATESRQRGREARLSTAGDGLSLDVALLDSLKRVLRPLVLARLGDAEDAPRRMHLSVRRGDDLLLVTLEDDGGASPDPRQMALAEAELTRAGGQLRRVAIPGGGLRYHLSLPMNLIVLEGMVVGAGGTRYVLPVAAIRTILQPDPANLVEVSATGGSRFLRLGKDEVVAIRSLGPETEDQGRREEGSSRVHIILAQENSSVAIPVDELIGQQLVLLRPLRGVMSRVRRVSGVALLAGGDVGMVLSPRALLNLRLGGPEPGLVHA